MKNLIESLALILVGLLSIAIVFFIVQYNLIEDETMLEPLFIENNKTSEVKSKNYLDVLEGYGDDTDVKVNARKENNKNMVSVESELGEDIFDKTIEDKSKSAYMENLENYSGVSNEEEKVNKISFNASGEPTKLAKDEIVDEVGLAIDALDL